MALMALKMTLDAFAAICWPIAAPRWDGDALLYDLKPRMAFVGLCNFPGEMEMPCKDFYYF